LVAEWHGVRAVIRVEEISVSDAARRDTVEMELVDSVYLGDKWEYHIRRGDFRAKAHGAKKMPSGTVHAHFPPESVWIFSGV
jgi:iron(III) transport system ATP-binding protein